MSLNNTTAMDRETLLKKKKKNTRFQKIVPYIFISPFLTQLEQCVVVYLSSVDLCS